jgi:hypothetical protein
LAFDVFTQPLVALTAGGLGELLEFGGQAIAGGSDLINTAVAADVTEVVATRGPIFADANVLVSAFKGGATALDEIRAGTTYITPNQLNEFLNVTEVSARGNFLSTEGIQVFGGPRAGQIASTTSFQETFAAVVNSQGRGDAALAAFAKATGYEAVTMERRLFNFITLTLKDSTIPIRRIKP